MAAATAAVTKSEEASPKLVRHDAGNVRCRDVIRPWRRRWHPIPDQNARVPIDWLAPPETSFQHSPPHKMILLTQTRCARWGNCGIRRKEIHVSTVSSRPGARLSDVKAHTNKMDSLHPLLEQKLSKGC